MYTCLGKSGETVTLLLLLLVNLVLLYALMFDFITLALPPNASPRERDRKYISDKIKRRISSRSGGKYFFFVIELRKHIRSGLELTAFSI